MRPDILLLMALMNYVNLNVALAGKRAKEAATKNLLGSQKSAIYLQYFKEGFVGNAGIYGFGCNPPQAGFCRYGVVFYDF